MYRLCNLWAHRQHLFKSLICCNDWVLSNYAWMLGAKCNIKMQAAVIVIEWNALQKVHKLPHLNFPSVYTYNRLGFTTSQVQSIPIHCHPSPTVGFNVQQQRGEGWFISLSTSSSSSPRSSSSGSLTATEGTAVHYLHWWPWVCWNTFTGLAASLRGWHFMETATRWHRWS